MTNDSIQKYTRMISDANPTQIIAIVFEMAEVYLDDAIMAHKDKDMTQFKSGIEKANKCIDDLIEALDLQYEIANQLLNIYMFLKKELSLSIVRQDVIAVERVQAMITKLKGSFEELSKQDSSGAAMGNTQSVYAGLTYGKGTLNESTYIQSNRGFTV